MFIELDLYLSAFDLTENSIYRKDFHALNAPMRVVMLKYPDISEFYLTENSMARKE